MKRITKRIKRLKDFSVWGNGWTKMTENDHKSNHKNSVKPKQVTLVCLVTDCIIKVANAEQSTLQ